MKHFFTWLVLLGSILVISDVALFQYQNSKDIKIKFEKARHINQSILIYNTNPAAIVVLSEELNKVLSNDDIHQYKIGETIKEIVK